MEYDGFDKKTDGLNLTSRESFLELGVRRVIIVGIKVIKSEMYHFGALVISSRNSKNASLHKIVNYISLFLPQLVKNY